MTKLEDGMKRLDKLTNEEARMANAIVLKISHGVDEKVTGVGGDVRAIDKKVKGVDGKVQSIGAQVKDVKGEVQVVHDIVKLVEENVQIIMHGAQTILGQSQY